MENLLFIKHYKDNHELRNSFNQLAMDTFGIQFEDWYERGYWTDKYIPYSLVKDQQVVANVSVNAITMLLNGKEIPAIQIGTVMTDKAHRNKGYSRVLMEKVLEDFAHIPFMYLFANDSVLHFYPKFGFRPMKETIFSCDYSYLKSNSSKIHKLDGTNLDFIYRHAQNRKPISDVFSTKGTAELAMFYAMKVFPNDVYWIEEEKAIVIYQHEGNTLHLYDIISTEEIDITKMLHHIATEDTKNIAFYFTPDFKNQSYTKQEFKDNTSLFVRTTREFDFPDYFKHPITSQA